MMTLEQFTTQCCCVLTVVMAIGGTFIDRDGAYAVSAVEVCKEVNSELESFDKFTATCKNGFKVDYIERVKK